MSAHKSLPTSSRQASRQWRKILRTIALLVMTAPTGAYARSRSAALDETILAEVKDYAPVEELPFYYLLRKVSTLSDNEPIQAEVDVKTLLKTPASLRGKLVQIMGTVYQLYDYELDDNPSGIRHVYQTELGDSSYQLFTAAFAEPPAAIEVQDTVLVRGYFLKIRAYEDSNGQTRLAPVLVARELVRVDSPRAYPKGGSFGIILTLFCLGLAVVGYFIWLLSHRRPIVFHPGKGKEASFLPTEKGDTHRE